MRLRGHVVTNEEDPAVDHLPPARNAEHLPI